MFRSLRVRLAITFLFLGLIPVVAVSFIVAQRSITSLIEQEIVNQQLLAQRVEIEIDAQLRESEKELNALIDILAPASLTEQEVQQLLQNIFSQRSTYNGLTFLDETGQEVIRLSRLSTIRELNDRSTQPEFADVMDTGAIYYSPIYFSDTLREPLVTLAIPIEDLMTGRVVNVLVADLRFKSIWDLIAATDVDEFSTVYVTDQSGRVVAHRNPSVVLSNTQTNLPNADGLATGLTGDDVILAMRSLQFGEQELTVVAERNLIDAFQNVRNTRDLAFGITGLVLVLAAILIYIFVDRVVRPIEDLSRTATLIQQGDLNLRASQQRDDEIGELAIAFNQMTDRLRNLIDSLEARVKSRTSELEEAREQSERASQAKSIFLSNMSHELRTPLNMVIGYTSSMLNMPQMYNGKDLPPEFRDDVQLIQENGRYLLGLINDILDLSKIEVGKLEIHPAAMNLQEIFQGVIATSIGLLKDKQIQIRPAYEEDLPLVWADPLRLRQILLNLMSNAIKFTDTGSVTLEAIQKGDQIQISVIDTGVGIPEDALQVIFDRFEQVQSKVSIQGTGLGLDISQRLAQMHGSEITIESELGRGSTFTFFINIATPEQIAESQFQPEEQPYSSIKVFKREAQISFEMQSVLLANGNSDERAKQRQLLESVDCIVVETAKSDDVFDFASGLLPDLILVNADSFKEPILSIYQPLRADATTEHIPMVWLSNVANPPIVDDYTTTVISPISDANLLKKLQEILQITVKDR